MNALLPAAWVVLLVPAAAAMTVAYIKRGAAPEPGREER